MKINRTYLFIVLSSIALLIVLIIQVNWVFNIAKIKEDIFNDKAKMVLAKTLEALGNDKVTCGNFEKGGSKNDKQKVDSLLQTNMKLYNIHIDYTFEINPAPSNENIFTNYLNLPQNSFQGCVDVPSSKSKLNFKLIFPEKEEFILAEMRMPFFISIVLILVVIIISWRTIFSVLKEKKIAEQTNDFLNNMTHEFKTPITNIALATKMITKELRIEKNEKQKKYTDIIQSENDKLKFQVEQILGMTELERGEIPLHQSKVNFDELIESVVHCMHLQFENCNAKINLELNAQNNSLLADAVHLNNAICNLLDNAIKYSTSNPIIVIKTFNERHDIVFTITDNGIGIDKSFHEKIFDKYFRVPTGNLHEVKGFGIGLAYTKFIIEKHGGAISLKSEKEKGTTFIISLPNA